MRTKFDVVKFDKTGDGLSFVLDDVRLELRRNLISLGTLGKDGFTLMMQSCKIKVIKGSLEVLSGTRMANCVYTLDGVYTTMYEEWSLLGVAGIQQRNGLVDGDERDTLGNMGFNESVEYEKTFIDFSVGTGLVQVLQGVEFEVESQKDHTFEVELHGNVSKVAGSPRSTNTKFDGLSFRTCRSGEDIAHESLTFNDIVPCEVISKWKARLKEEMDTRWILDQIWYFFCGCKAEIWVTKGLLDKAKRECTWYSLSRVESQEYQVVCTRPDMVFGYVGMFDGVVRGL
nr:zinc finger, CCHC-type [Tanacetum cinerariifolium]